MWNVTLDFPALVLIAIFVLMFWVFWQGHKADNGLNFADMLKDEHGKASSARMAIFVCLAITSWGIMYILLTRKGEIDPIVFGAYAIVWSGAKVAEKLVDAFIYYRSGVTPPKPTPPAPPAPSKPAATDDDDHGPMPSSK